MENITRISQEMREGRYVNNPHKCAEDLSILSGEYGWLCGQIEDILVRKPEVWNKIRLDTKSDITAERKYQATPDGINEMGLRLRLRGCEKMMSALKTFIRLATEEAKNIL